MTAQLFSTPLENNIVGSLISTDGEFCDDIARVIDRVGLSTLFMSPRASAAMAVMMKMYQSGLQPDQQIIAQRLDNAELSSFKDTSPQDYVTDVVLSATLTTRTTFTNALSTLERLGVLREQLDGVSKILSETTEDSSPADVNAQLMSIVSTTAHPESSLVDIATLYHHVRENPRTVWSVSTGLPSLDKALGGKGIESGTNVVIGARGKVGKTTFMLSLISAVTATDSNNMALVANFETQKHEFLARLVAYRVKLDWKKIDQYLTSPTPDECSSLTQEEKDRVEAMVVQLQEENIVQVSGTADSLTTADIEAHVIALQRQNPGKCLVLFVDYIQLQVKNQREAINEITELSRFYKMLAVKYNIGVVYLTQMNRGNGDMPPTVMNIASSDSISRDADVIILLDRPFMRGNKDYLPSHMNVDATHTRLASGSTFTLTFDGADQSVFEAPSDTQGVSSSPLKQFTDEFTGGGDIWADYEQADAKNGDTVSWEI